MKLGPSYVSPSLPLSSVFMKHSECVSLLFSDVFDAVRILEASADAYNHGFSVIGNTKPPAFSYLLVAPLGQA